MDLDEGFELGPGIGPRQTDKVGSGVGPWDWPRARDWAAGSGIGPWMGPVLGLRAQASDPPGGGGGRVAVAPCSFQWQLCYR